MGKEYGEVAIANRRLPEEKIVAPLKKIIRIATEKDARQHKENMEKEMRCPIMRFSFRLR